MASDKGRARRRWAEGSMMGAAVLLGLALFGFANYFGWKYHKRFDWTSSDLYSLSEKSRNVLAQLDRDVEVIVFMEPSDQLYDAVTEMLSRYEAASSHLSLRIVDPARNLAEAQALVDKFQVSSLNVVVFDAGEDRRVVDTADLADYDYSGMQYGQQPKLKGFKGEQQFTSALLNLMESRKPRILFTTGHGEHKLDDFSPSGLSAAADYLKRDNFEADEWSSLGEQAVPEGTDLLVIAGPTGSFVAPEVEALRAYVQSGGRLLVLVDPTFGPAGGSLVDTGLGELLGDYGVVLGDDIIVDPANPLPFFGAETFFANAWASHPITEPLNRAELPVILSLARSVATAKELPEELHATELLHTSSDGWGETDLDNLQRVEKGDEDHAGPVSLGVAVEIGEQEAATDQEAEQATVEEASTEDTEASAVPTEASDADAASGEETANEQESTGPGARLVVMGDADFATNAQIQNAGNAVLLADILNWLVEREQLLAIPAKEPEQVRLSLTSAELRRITWLVLAVLPGLIIGLGIYVHSRRRR